jgi:opacity protein-like surface antigen
VAKARHSASSAEGGLIRKGSFKSKHNAENYKLQLTKQYHHPVTIKKIGNYYVVYIGSSNLVVEETGLNGHAYQATPAKEHFVDKDAALAPMKDPNHLDVMGALGVAQLNSGTGYLGITSSETDRLNPNNNNGWDAFTGQIGVGYVLYLHGAQQYSENTQWFPWVEPQIRGYYLGNSTINGDVWRFGNPVWNDMTYSLSIKSYRLMFDTALTLVSKRQYSLYALGGIGNAWNRTGYSDADRTSVPCANQFLNLNTTTNSNFSWEAGAGLAYTLNDRVAFSLEYLYADLGTMQTSANGVTGSITAPVLVPADFKLTSQAVLFGLHVAL